MTSKLAPRLLSELFHSYFYCCVFARNNHIPKGKLLLVELPCKDVLSFLYVFCLTTSFKACFYDFLEDKASQVVTVHLLFQLSKLQQDLKNKYEDLHSLIEPTICDSWYCNFKSSIKFCSLLFFHSTVIRPFLIF